MEALDYTNRAQMAPVRQFMHECRADNLNKADLDSGRDTFVELRIPFRPGCFVDNKRSYLRIDFEVEQGSLIQDSTGLRFDRGAESMLHCVRIYHGNQLLERIMHYGKVNALIEDLSQRHIDDNHTSGRQHNPIYTERTHLEELKGTNQKRYKVGVRHTVCFPLNLSGILCGQEMQQYLPIGLAGMDDLRIELQFQNVSSFHFNTTAPDTRDELVKTISNNSDRASYIGSSGIIRKYRNELGVPQVQLREVAYHAHYLEYGPNDFMALMQPYMADGRLVINTRSYDTYEHHIDGSEKTIHRLLPAKYSSINTVLTTFQRMDDQSGVPASKPLTEAEYQAEFLRGSDNNAAGSNATDVQLTPSREATRAARALNASEVANISARCDPVFLTGGLTEAAHTAYDAVDGAEDAEATENDDANFARGSIGRPAESGDRQSNGRYQYRVGANMFPQQPVLSHQVRTMEVLKAVNGVTVPDVPMRRDPMCLAAEVNSHPCCLDISQSGLNAVPLDIFTDIHLPSSVGDEYLVSDGSGDATNRYAPGLMMYTHVKHDLALVFANGQLSVVF